MSLLDFKQEAHYQGCLHIAVTPLDEVNSSLYVAVCERLCSLPPVQLSGTVLFLRFIRASEVPPWSGKGPKWDEFSAHKQILGVLGVAQCSDVDDLTNAKASLKAATTAFKPNVCEAKCVVYGPKKYLESAAEAGSGLYVINSTVEQDAYDANDVCGWELEELVKCLAQDICSKLNTRINSVEKMLNQTGRSDSLPLLKSPFESKGVLMQQDEDASESRPLSRNHIISRLEKHLGDLYLLTGQLQQASARYRNALPSLKSFKDWLWAGSVYEGLSVTAIITKECEEVLGQKAQGTAIGGTSSIFKKYTQRGNQVAGVSSFAARTSSTLDSRRKAPAERLASDPNVARLAKYATTTRRTPSKSGPADISRNESDEGLVMKTLTPQPATPLPLAVVEEDSGLLDIGDERDGVMESIQYEVEADVEGEGEGEERWFIDSRLLEKDFIAKQYSLALFTYRKGGEPGSICQIEALLKFARYLAKQKKSVKAAETLQRILKIECRLFAYLDKVNLYITIAEVYKSMNFSRKAAMFTYYAASWVISHSAMLHLNVSDVQSHNLVFQANSLLVDCLPGFKLSSNLEDLPKQTAAHIGWPSLQAYVLKDFVFTSRELQKDIEAIKLSCYLLQFLYMYLSKAELEDLTTMLADIVQEAHDKAKVNPMFAASIKGRLASPIPLVNFPLVHSFIPKPLVDHLKAYKIKGFTSPVLPDEGGKAALSGPFIYTPIGRKKKDNRLEVVWVEDEPGEIAVEIVNPLPFDLKVERMTVKLEGVNTEMYPSTLVLPSGEPQSFVLACIPKEPGILSILGYKTCVFGVENECQVKIPGDPVVRVVPQLPQLRVKVLQSSLESCDVLTRNEVEASNGIKRKMSKAVNDKLELMDGESCQCDFLLESSKQADIESLTVSLKDYNTDYCQFSFDQDIIDSLLPITKSKIACFTVSVQAKFPPWFRVINDATSSFTRKAVGLFDSSTSQGSVGTPESSLKSEYFFSSNNSSPTSSPTPKRARGAAHGLLTFKVPIKRKSSDSAYSSLNQESMTLESLDLHIPQKPGQSSSQGSSPVRYHNSLGRNVKPPKSGQRRAVDDVEAALDGGFSFSMDSKRASVRSDPGDREESKLSRFTLRKDSPSVHSETKPVAIPKSETTTGRLSDMSNGGSPLFFGGGAGGGASYQASLTSGVLFGAESKTQSLARGLKSSNNKGKWHQSSSGSNTRYISNPIGPLYKENLRPPSKVKVVGEFSLEYSGGKGLQEGFCRECRTNVQIMVKPVLTFEQFDVTLVEGSQSLFELSFIMSNISKCKLHITCKVNQEGLLECGGLAEQKHTLDPGSSQKMLVALKRFVVHDSQGAIRNESHMAKLYSEKLSQIIQFVWQEVNKRKQGVITLDGIRLATSCVSLMRPVPLRFEVNMNGQNFVPKGQNSFIQDLKVGEPFKVSLTLINNSGLLMPSSYLVLDPYQFSEELKRIVKDLRGKMITTSCFVTKIPELEPCRFYVYEVTLVFLQKGMFQLDIKSMTPSDDQPHPRSSTGSSLEPHSRTSSCTEATMSRSPIKKVSKPDTKNRPSQHKSGEKSVSKRGSRGDSSLPSGGTVNKEKSVPQSPKSSPASTHLAAGLPKKSKPPASPVAKKFGPAKEEPSNHRTNSVDNELTSFLPNVAKMVSMIEGRAAAPPVPTSARPKLKGVASVGGSVQSADQPLTSNSSSTISNNVDDSSSNSRVEKKPHPTITGSSALAKPLPLDSLNTCTKSLHSDNTERQRQSTLSQDDSKKTQPSAKRSRLAPRRIDSMILLSSQSRSQNLWNARLQNSNSVRLLSGPHFTFNVT